MEYVCEICKKNFKSQISLRGHLRMHGPSNGKIQMSEERKEKYRNEKELRKIECKNCKCKFNRKKLKNIFCSTSCSALFTNKGKIKTETTKNKISKSLKETKKFFSKYWGNYTKIKIYTCKTCKIKKYQESSKEFSCCKETRIPRKIRYLYSFKFEVNNYPDLFDLKMIKDIGWYCAIKTSKKYNIKGLTRDHRVSVKFAYENSLNPYYITHPINCHIMTQSKNSSKKDSSSLSWEELVTLVDEYDSNKSTLQQSDASTN